MYHVVQLTEENYQTNEYVAKVKGIGINTCMFGHVILFKLKSGKFI